MTMTGKASTMKTDLDLPIEWAPEFSTGIQTIDDQHRVLISMLNDVNAKFNDHSPSHQFEAIVRGLLNYANYHFSTEERYATESGYLIEETEEAARHLAQHQAFSKELASIKTRTAIGQRISKAELLYFLTDWLLNHILHTDKKLGAFLNTRTSPPA